MKRFLQNKCVVAALVLGGLTVVGANEYSISAQSSYGTPTVTISPAAQAQLGKTKAAYAALTFFAGDIKVETTGLPDNWKVDAKLTWQKPNKLRVEYDNGVGPSVVVSNGDTMWTKVAYAPGQYLEKPVSASRSVVPGVLTESGLDKTTFGSFLSEKDPLRQFGTALQSIELKPVKIGGKVASDRVALVMKLVRRKDEGTATFIIDSKTNLLRSVKIARPVNGIATTVNETIGKQRLKLSVSDNFEYSPTAGETRIDKFQKLPYDPRLVAGAEPFSLDVADIDGKMLRWDDYKGKVVLLYFWSPWHASAKPDAGAVTALYNAHKARGFEIIGVNLDSDTLNLRPFMQYYGMTWRQYYDGKGMNNLLAQRFGITALPIAVLVGRDGKIVTTLDNNVPRRQALVAQALAQKAE